MRKRHLPLRRELADVAPVDLGERTIAATTGIAVVAWPIGLRGHFAIFGIDLAQEMNTLVGSLQLEVFDGFVEDRAFQLPAVYHVNRSRSQTVVGARPQ